METVQSGAASAVKFDLADGAGGVLAPSGLAVRILDELDQVLSDWQVIGAPASGERYIEVPIAQGLNSLAPGLIRGLRAVELRLDLPASQQVLSTMYVVVAASQLVPGVNSFSTYKMAVLASLGLPEGDLEGWSTATEADRVRNMEAAFHRIRDLPIYIEWENNQSVIRDCFFDPPVLRELTAAQILALDERLLKALRLAQLLEASALMTPDPIGDLRRQGIQSQTTGESSMYFGASRPLSIANGVSPRALRALSKWLRQQQRITRR